MDDEARKEAGDFIARRMAEMEAEGAATLPAGRYGYPHLSTLVTYFLATTPGVSVARDGDDVLVRLPVRRDIDE